MTIVTAYTRGTCPTDKERKPHALRTRRRKRMVRSFRFLQELVQLSRSPCESEDTTCSKAEMAVQRSVKSKSSSKINREPVDLATNPRRQIVLVELPEAIPSWLFKELTMDKVPRSGVEILSLTLIEG